MAIHFFERAQLQEMAWKNGSGVTCEIACYPPTASLHDFDWRISIAHISRDCDFSAFNGVDRVITLLDGCGVHLGSLDGQVDHLLNVRWSPFAFSGDLPVHARLLGGGCHDLNVMTRRDVCQVSISVLKAGDQLSLAPAGFLFALQGKWELQATASAMACSHQFSLAPETGLWWAGDSLSWSCQSVSSNCDSDAALVAALIQPTAH